MTSPVSKDWPRKKYTNEQERKCHKPILEKKRRARINKSLDHLKALLLETMKEEAGHFSKLEKADILEMTVKHLQELQQKQLNVAMVMDPTVKQKYHSGYSECTGEVERYLSTVDGLRPDVKNRLMDHLDLCNRGQSSNSSAYAQQAPPTLHPLSAFQNLPRIRSNLPSAQTQPLLGPVSPPMYQNILDVNRTHDMSGDRIMQDVQPSFKYSTVSNALSLSMNAQENTFACRLPYGEGHHNAKPHTVTSQNVLSENNTASKANNMQKQSSALSRQTVTGSCIIDKENSTKGRELNSLNNSTRRLFAVGQPRPLGDLNLNSFTNRVPPKMEQDKHAEAQISLSWLNAGSDRKNTPQESSVSASVNVVKDEAMWRPW